MKQRIKSNIGFIYISLCILLWSLVPTFAKFGQVTLDQHQYLFYSSVISFITIAAISLYSKNINEVLSYSWKVFLILFGLGFLNFFYYLLLYLGYKEANGLEVLVIQYLWPIFIVILSIIILKEKLSLSKALSVILGFSGVTIVITKGNLTAINLSNLNILFTVMLGSFSFALFSVLGKVVKINPINAVMLYFLSGSIFSFISMCIFSEVTFPSSNDWLSISINGAFLNGITYIFWIKALQMLDASQVAPYIFITPILSAILLIIVFNEPILHVYYIGLSLVIVSGLLNSVKSKTKS